MSPTQKSELIGHRAELLAEMFLADCGASVTRSPSGGFDFLAFFSPSEDDLQVIAVEVKSTESPIPKELAIDSKLLKRAARSNIPVLLLVVDVKQNKLGFAWIDQFASRANGAGHRTKVPLSDAEKCRAEIGQHVLSGATSRN